MSVLLEMPLAWRRLAAAGFAAALCLASPVAGAQAGAPAATGTEIDSIARLLAGVEPSHPAHARLAETGEWKEHSRAMRAAWQQVHDKQLASLIAWRKAEMPGGCPVGRTLLYPFSGADFLNAYWLFPDCEKLVLFGLERPGEVPDISGMTRQELARLLPRVRSFMINLFVRNYFVTSTMHKDTQNKELRGLAPVFMASMAMSGVEVLSVSKLRLGVPAGAAPGFREVTGIAIEYRAPDSPRTRHLTYLSVDAVDASLAEHPEFFEYLRGLGPTTTLIKSASYLLHARQFSRVREALLEASDFILQDDTGMPYGVLTKNGWGTRLYGQYGVPIAPFGWAYQPALAAAYENAKPLPFRFGYQFDSGENRSNLIIAQRSSARAAAGSTRR